MKYWTIGTLFLAQAALAHGDSIEACKEHFYLGVPPSFNAKHENREETRFVCKEYKGTPDYVRSSCSNLRTGPRPDPGGVHGVLQLFRPVLGHRHALPGDVKRWDDRAG